MYHVECYVSATASFYTVLRQYCYAIRCIPYRVYYIVHYTVYTLGYGYTVLVLVLVLASPSVVLVPSTGIPVICNIYDLMASSSESSFFLLKVILQFGRHSILLFYPYPTLLKLISARQPRTRGTQELPVAVLTWVSAILGSVYAKSYQHSSCRVKLSGTYSPNG